VWNVTKPKNDLKIRKMALKRKHLEPFCSSLSDPALFSWNEFVQKDGIVFVI